MNKTLFRGNVNVNKVILGVDIQIYLYVYIDIQDVPAYMLQTSGVGNGIPR